MTAPTPAIRAALAQRFGPRKYRITPDGEIHVFGFSPGSNVESSYLFGRVSDRDISDRLGLKTITIKTKRNDGIYKSDSGGEVETLYEFATGPRNLLKAIQTLGERVGKTRLIHGNTNCSRIWLELDGVAIHDFDLARVACEDCEANGTDASPSSVRKRTVKAASLIAEVQAGEYAKNRAAANVGIDPSPNEQ